MFWLLLFICVCDESAVHENVAEIYENLFTHEAFNLSSQKFEQKLWNFLCCTVRKYNLNTSLPLYQISIFKRTHPGLTNMLKNFVFFNIENMTNAQVQDIHIYS